MHDRARCRSAIIRELLATLVLVAAALPVAAGSYRAFPHPIELEREVVPACTPLRVVGEHNEAAPDQILVRSWLGGWLFEMSRAQFDAGPFESSFAACLERAVGWALRLDDQDRQQFLERRLALGMPVELALLVLGPPTSVEGDTSASRFTWGTGDERRSRGGKRIEFDRLLVVDRVVLNTDTAGDIAVIELYGGDREPHAPDPPEPNTYLAAMERCRSGDLTSAARTLETLASWGDPRARHRLGRMLLDGDGVGRDPDAGVRLIRSAAEAPLAEAALDLAILYLRGDVLERDPIEAGGWLLLASELDGRKPTKLLEGTYCSIGTEELERARQRFGDREIRRVENIVRVAPDFPEPGRIERRDGRVILAAWVRADGTFEEIEIRRAEPLGFGFERAAIEALRHWRYRPAIVDGEPVASWTTVTLDFTIHGGKPLRWDDPEPE